MAKRELTQKDYEYINSLSEAVLLTSPKKLRLIMYIWVAVMAGFLVWASWAKVDEISRGNGQVVSSSHNKMIQHLEGGIVEEILVKEGEQVVKNQPLLKIKNQKSTASFVSNESQSASLRARAARLKAEYSGSGAHGLIADEQMLYNSNIENLNAKISKLQEKISQSRAELADAKSKKEHLKMSLGMINEEVRMTGPMVEKGVKSKVEYLKLQREANEAENAYQSATLSIPRLESIIQENQKSIEESRYEFRSKAQKEYNEVMAQLGTLRADGVALSDQEQRTTVRSPMDGVVQSLFVHTLGGVVKPGDNLVEIVPNGDKLIVEVKLKPSDIAFIYAGQKAIVKLSAYDFAVYGSLSGKVIGISADTKTDKKEEAFYTVRIETDKSYLEHNGKKLSIITGMTLSADIITGRKSVLDYILKPILKTKQHMLSER